MYYKVKIQYLSSFVRSIISIYFFPGISIIKILDYYKDLYLALQQQVNMIIKENEIVRTTNWYILHMD